MAFRVRRLEADDDRSAFRSGNVELDRFLSRYAGQNEFRHHLGTTYVAVDETGAIAGFVTVSPSELGPEALPSPKRKGLAKYPLPVLRLARLGVDDRVKGQGIGSLLLRSALILAQRMADEFGCVGVVVDAKLDAVAFYQKLGFCASTLQRESSVIGRSR